jgi:hypothetical protein
MHNKLDESSVRSHSQRFCMEKHVGQTVLFQLDSSLLFIRESKGEMTESAQHSVFLLLSNFLRFTREQMLSSRIQTSCPILLLITEVSISMKTTTYEKQTPSCNLHLRKWLGNSKQKPFSICNNDIGNNRTETETSEEKKLTMVSWATCIPLGVCPIIDPSASVGVHSTK